MLSLLSSCPSVFIRINFVNSELCIPIKALDIKRWLASAEALGPVGVYKCISVKMDR